MVKLWRGKACKHRKLSLNNIIKSKEESSKGNKVKVLVMESENVGQGDSPAGASSGL
jgi:hypothetical protein